MKLNFDDKVCLTFILVALLFYIFWYTTVHDQALANRFGQAANATNIRN